MFGKRLIHEAYGHVEPAQHETFKNHLRTAVAQFASEPENSVGAIKHKPKGRILHEAYFNEPRLVDKVKDSLQAALKLMGEEEAPKSEFKVDYLHGIGRPTSEERQLSQAGYIYRLRVWQPGGTFIRKRMHKIKIRKLMDLFHKMLTEEKVPAVAFTNE
ncbi:MAG: hypothetical protein V1644_00635 [Candidatus Micrarchaeota archaeon]